jgi:sugar-specific transcriptional regulator TrmB
MEKELRDFGLTDKEIKVYLALLKLGTAKIQEISEKAETYRTYTYDLIKSLKEKGLVSYVIKSGVQYYEVSEPDKLINLLREKERKIEKILPSLKEIYQSSSEKPEVEVFEGKQGIKTIFDDMIKTKKEIWVYGSTKRQLSLLEFSFPNFIQRRIKEKIKTRVLTEKSSETLSIKKRNKRELRQTKFFIEDLDLPNVINIYGDKVAILDFKEGPLGIVIKSESFSNTQRIIFEILWKSAKP